MSFATLDQVYTLIEGLFASVFKLINVDLPTPFPRFSFEEVMRRFGSDKPDLRIKGLNCRIWHRQSKAPTLRHSLRR